MDDELRKAAGTAVDVWDDTGTRHEDVVNAMNDLRKVLAKNANVAPQDQDAKMDEIRKTLKIGMNTGKALREGTNEDTAKDAARWRYIAAHWENGTIRYNRDGSFRGLTMAVRDSYRGAYPDAIALVIDEAMEQKP